MERDKFWLIGLVKSLSYLGTINRYRIMKLNIKKLGLTSGVCWSIALCGIYGGNVYGWCRRFGEIPQQFIARTRCFSHNEKEYPTSGSYFGYCSDIHTGLVGRCLYRIIV